MSGRLILCATPIGNLEDTSDRARRVLSEADVIACEDTRRTRKLMSHFGIEGRDMVVYNEATERRKERSLIETIGQGRTVVLVSDAGTPGLSDPGFRLVRACIDNDLPVEIVPGPNAAISALAISGLAPGRFVFEGFLPRKSSERKRHLAGLADQPRTLVFYESPHRVAASLEDMREVFGEGRRAALVREMTKMYEEVWRGTLGDLAARAEGEPPRGEIVVVVEGAVGGSRKEVAAEDLAAEARKLMDDGVPRGEALSMVAQSNGVPKRRVFDALVEH